MAIVLDEYKWAEEAIKNRKLGKKPFETFVRVAKYYFRNGKSKTEVREGLDDFLLSCDRSTSLVSWSNVLDEAVKRAQKYPIILIDGIHISKGEMDMIDALDGRQIKRLAFTLLCIAKYYHIVSPDTDYWVSTPDNEIMKMANINTSIKRQSLMFSQLKDAGMIRFSKRIDNLSVQVLFADDGETVLTVSDFRNLGYQYLKYHGDPYYTCTNCGLVCKPKDPAYLTRYKYCEECASKIMTRQQVNAVMRSRSLQKM